MQNYLNGIATYYQPERAATYLVNHIVLTQYGMQKGIKVFGQAGVNAIIKEMQQFED